MYEALLKATPEYQKVAASFGSAGPAALFGLPPAGRAQHKVPGREHRSSKPQRLEVVRKMGGLGFAGGHDAQHPVKVFLQGGIQQRPACGRQTEQRRRPCGAKACGDLLIFRGGLE